MPEHEFPAVGRGIILDVPLGKLVMAAGVLVAVVGLVLIPLPGPGFVIVVSGVLMVLSGLALRLLHQPKRQR